MNNLGEHALSHECTLFLSNQMNKRIHQTHCLQP